MTRQPEPKMTARRALSLAVLVLQFEAESSKAPTWQREVTEAARLLAKVKARITPQPPENSLFYCRERYRRQE